MHWVSMVLDVSRVPLICFYTYMYVSIILRDSKWISRFCCLTLRVLREPRIEPARRGRCLITEKSQGLCEDENFGCQRHVLRRQYHSLNTILKNPKLRETTFFTAREDIYILSLIIMKVEIAEEENLSSLHMWNIQLHVPFLYQLIVFVVRRCVINIVPFS
jgi:hypothetical protein